MKAIYKLRILIAKIAASAFFATEVFNDRQKLLFFRRSIESSDEQPKIRIHIGCGQVNALGWINIDAKDFLHVGIRTDHIDLDIFRDSSIDEIYICHLLEHFSFEEAAGLLQLFRIKLKPGGHLRISVPDFDSIIQIYNNSYCCVESIRMILMGGQDCPYNFHKSIYNYKYLSNLLLSQGFTHIQSWDPQDDMLHTSILLSDFSSYYYPTPNGSVMVSLNLVASR